MRRLAGMPPDSAILRRQGRLPEQRGRVGLLRQRDAVRQHAVLTRLQTHSSGTQVLLRRGLQARQEPVRRRRRVPGRFRLRPVLHQYGRVILVRLRRRICQERLRMSCCKR